MTQDRVEVYSVGGWLGGGDIKINDFVCFLVGLSNGCLKKLEQFTGLSVLVRM